MVGRIHLDQRAHQVRCAGDPARPLLDRLHRQRCRPIRIVKEIVLPADGLDMGMSGDDPERIEAYWPRNAERIVGPEPAIGIVKAMIGIGGGIDQRRGNVGWEVGGVTQAQDRTLRFAKLWRWFGEGMTKSRPGSQESLSP